ncbi:aromatic amino acid DMT transporter YddG [Aquabacterium sp.]|uniref:aromatic amino acid DMT transporter YddG n=1 Tax=Aquabacterium sp. TaxID=1872578 RepID=UPI0037848015
MAGTRVARSAARATALGLAAVLLWSTSVGITRNTTELLGATGAPAVLFTVSALLLWPGRSALGAVPRTYLWLGGLLFVGYQLCFVLALALARTRSEAIEVGMVNYLWPSLTVLSATLAGGRRPNAPMLLGLGLAFAGIVTTASPAEGLSLTRFFAHAAAHPLSYGLALGAAVVWALYSTCTRYLAGGQSALWLYVALSAAAFWVLHALQADRGAMRWSVAAVWLVVLSSASVALAYSFWNHGLLHGNIHLLALAANGTPVLAALFASVLLRTPLTLTFWVGAFMVAIGSALAGHGSQRLGSPARRI